MIIDINKFDYRNLPEHPSKPTKVSGFFSGPSYLCRLHYENSKLNKYIGFYRFIVECLEEREFAQEERPYIQLATYSEKFDIDDIIVRHTQNRSRIVRHIQLPGQPLRPYDVKNIKQKNIKPNKNMKIKEKNIPFVKIEGWIDGHPSGLRPLTIICINAPKEYVWNSPKLLLFDGKNWLNWPHLTQYNIHSIPSKFIQYKEILVKYEPSIN